MNDEDLNHKNTDDSDKRSGEISNPDERNFADSFGEGLPEQPADISEALSGNADSADLTEEEPIGEQADSEEAPIKEQIDPEEELFRQKVLLNEQAQREKRERENATWQETPPPENVAEPKEIEPTLPEKEKKQKLTKAEKKALKEKTKEENKNMPKKRRGCFFHCCLTFLIFNFVCACLLIGVGWYFGDQFSRQYLDMSLTDTFGVVTGITSVNDNFIDNRFDQEKDEAGFYDSLGSAMMLEDGALDSEKFKTAVVDGVKGEGDISYSLENYLVDSLKAENIDKDKIENIGTTLQDTDFVVSDKEIGAFLNGVVSSAVETVLVSELKDAGLDQYGIDVEKLRCRDYVSVEQLKLYIENKMVDNVPTDVNMTRVTLSVNFSQLMKDVKKALNTDTFIANNMPDAQSYSSVISFAIKSGLNVIKIVLPSKLYLTVDMGLSHSVEPAVYINNMGMGNDKMEHLYKLLDKINIDLKNEIHNLFVDENGGVKQAIDSINSVAPLNKILTDGGINCDIYQLIIDMAKLNYTEDSLGNSVLKAPDERINSDDLLGAMKLILEDNTEYLEDLKDDEYSYKNVKFKLDANGNLDLSTGRPIIEDSGKKEYYVTDAEELDELLDAYDRLIISELTEAYGLKEEFTLNEIINRFAGRGDGSAIDMFDADKIKAIMDGEAKGVELDDRMLGAMFMEMLPDLIEDSDISSNELGIEYLYIEERKESENSANSIGKISADESGANEDGETDHKIIHLGLDLSIDSLINKVSTNQLISKLMNNLIAGKRYVVEIAIDVTPEIEEGNRIQTELLMNGNSAQSLSKIMASLGAFGKDETGKAVSLGSYLDTLMNPLRDLISNMNSTLPGLTIKESALKMPDIYSAIAGFLNNKSEEDEEEKFDGETVEKILNLIVNEDPLSDPDGDYVFFDKSNSAAVASYYENCEDALVDSLVKQYSLKRQIEDKRNDPYTLKLKDILYVLKVTQKPDSTQSKAILDEIGMMDLIDPTIMEGLSDSNESDFRTRLVVNVTNSHDFNVSGGKGDQFTALIRQVVFEEGKTDFAEFEGKFNRQEDFLYASLSKENGKNYLYITIRVKIKDVINKDGEGASFMTALLPDSPSLVTFKVDITDSDEHDKTTAIVNDNLESSDSLFDMLEALKMCPDFESIGDNVRTSIKNLDNTFSGIVFDDKLMVLPNVFNVINQVVLEGEYDDFSVKHALAGVYRTSETKKNDKTKIDIYKESLSGDNLVSPSENCSTFIKDVKNKYFLTDESLKIKEGENKDKEVTKFEELTKVIDVNSFDASNIIMTPAKDEDKIQAIDNPSDGQDNEGTVSSEGLAYTVKEEKDLKPHMTVADFGEVISENLPERAKLYKLEINENGNLILHLTMELNKLFEDSQKDISKTLGVGTVFFNMVVYLNESPLTSNGTTYYRCEIVTNSMEKADSNTLFSMLEKIDGSDSGKAVEDLEKDAGGTIYTAFEKLEKMYGAGGYEINKDGLVISDVFTFLGKNLVKNGDPLSGENVRKAIQGMYPVLENKTEGGADKNDNNYVKDNIVKNPIATELKIDNKGVNGVSEGGEQNASTVAEQILSAGGIGDKNLGAYVQSQNKKDNNVTVLQLSILAGNSEGSTKSDSNQKKDREYYNSHLDNEHKLDDSETYIALTVEAPVTKFGDGLSANAQKVMPEKMIVTFILKRIDAEASDGSAANKTVDHFEYVDFILNDMTVENRNTLIRLTGMDVDTVKSNVEDISDESLGNINELFDKIGATAESRSFKDPDNTSSGDDDGKTSRGRYEVNKQDSLHS